MKIVCDNCGAKYSIADEKVAGKVFKIRCKKCSDVIVVRGDTIASDEEEATRVFDYGGEAVWHVVIDGEQQGPHAPVQLAGLLTDGSMDWDTYVWKEGFDGWVAARDVPELVEQLSGGSGDTAAPTAGGAPEEAPTAAAAAGAAAADVGEPAAAAPPAEDQGKADLFASSAGEDFSGASAAGGAEPAGGGDLFAAAGDADPFAGTTGAGEEDHDEDVVASQPSPRVSASQASMTGQRNENSVLFSLSNLQALATGPEAGGESPAPSPSAPAPSAPATGHAQGEGSGLIDIRALASATAATSDSSSPPSGGGGGGNVDDLLSIGTGSAGLGASLGSPVLSPAASEDDSSGPNLKILYGLVGVLALGLIGAVIFLVTREPQQVVVQQQSPPTGTAAGSAAGEGPPGAAGATDPGANGEETTLATTNANEEADDSEDETEDQGEGDDRRSAAQRARDRQRAGSSRDRTARQRASARASSMTESTMESAPAPSMTSSMAAGGDSLEALMDGVVGMGMAAAPMSNSNLPSTPSRGAVRSALGGVAGRVRSCGDGSGGTAMARVTFSSSGRVASVNVSGVSGSIASCVSRAVRGARVPAFSQSSFNVNFPYRLQ